MSIRAVYLSEEMAIFEPVQDGMRSKKRKSHSLLRGNILLWKEGAHEMDIVALKRWLPVIWLPRFLLLSPC
ncbi:hypothetical protein EI42_00225 [Thermosporothrix hazakensis]|jgi:hypothetical protein|uniref:Uncharacterized protein n=1 Tax=Thermosporothrix hazakensis TaxID=644383 RepID=A0A326UDQ2_THEHA|nr:hypothetical protein EI42_00225 [Thermosporothrix hazakensis]